MWCTGALRRRSFYFFCESCWFIGRFACMIQSKMDIYSWTLLVFSLLFGFNWIIHYAELNQRVSLTKRRVFVRGTENRATSLVWWICGCKLFRSCYRYRDEEEESTADLTVVMLLTVWMVLFGATFKLSWFDWNY